MNVHQDDSGLASARPMRSGYYWFVDQYGSLISHILLRIVEGASVALYRHKGTSTAELLPSRRDLFNYEGGYGWGYGGSGPQNLSHAIASRIFLLDNLDDQELRRRARVILDKVISQPSLNSETNHDVTVESIKQLFV
ncbi:hypothetical protein [Xanthomonas campestris]|uniref:hypothetical protein n=1 Tax=Xanthomonas campestris TaxID=339 RepID=UPI000AF59564|nr:hypothetical protein [Xanthomonas campestris]MEB1432534.1 hypothetical protein [Xanthomonas campestris pv. campestris]MEB1998081.1 hypothetical protein [Xanthomonas campestris pv. campestris]MEB2006712.1 hypothetical protein [Xanthomonas campestris pv. campestris]MEB2142345.1 hypothetical protein [Xanthomonas campestris pv. campestris]MEB2159236.1 hypothetical protein [Xanthomonas campestris pv. campestris]